MENSKNFFQSMDHFKPLINTNGLTNDTISQIANFQKGISQLQAVIKPEVIYEYIEHQKKLDGVSEEIYQQLDDLKEIQTRCISNETPFIKAQIKKSSKNEGEEIDKQILSDTFNKVKDFITHNRKSSLPMANIAMSDSVELMEQIRNLKVLTFFDWILVEDYFKLKNDEKSVKDSFPDIDQMH